MAWSQLWAVEMLIAAFAGGAFGAAVGALPSFIFTGFMVIAGEAANIVQRLVGATDALDPATLGTVGITGSVAFGPVFSPAIAFGGGVAAAAYASKKGYMESGFDYHNAKDIGFALGTKPDVLAVGGVFGVVGYWLTIASETLGMPYDPIAMGVVLSALLVRLTFSYDLVGKPEKGWLNMRPFENEELRVIGDAAVADDEARVADGGTETTDRLLVEPWLPHQYKWANVATLGVVAGILGGFVAVKTGSAFLAFGISAASLVFLNCGVERIPVTHHMTFPASTATLAYLGTTPDPTARSAVLAAVVLGGVFGLACALFGELFQRIFYAHGDTHVDPPAAAIVFGTFTISVLAAVGVFPSSAWVPALF